MTLLHATYVVIQAAVEIYLAGMLARDAQQAHEIHAIAERMVRDDGRIGLDVVSSVKRVTEIIGEISSASREQSSGIEQVNQASSRWTT